MRTRDVEKEQLVKENAIEMMVQEGFEGFSMNKLARVCGISVATLYIYYRDKEDLIQQIGSEIAQDLTASTFDGFTPEMPFAEGLWKQWENRAAFLLNHPLKAAYNDMLRHSPYAESSIEQRYQTFRDTMQQFLENAIRNRELVPVSAEVFWSVAFGPLYSLLRFHQEGKSIGGRPFKFSHEAMEEAFQLVMKALSPASVEH